jgi:hypothetical protein
MKRFFYIAAIFLFALHLNAQTDKVEALRMSYISKRLELSGSESERFWPLYNEYNDKVRAIRMNLRQSFRKFSDKGGDRDAEDLYQLELRGRQAETDVHRVYAEKIRSVIGVRKYIRLRIAEEDFKREMISIIREKGD